MNELTLDFVCPLCKEKVSVHLDKERIDSSDRNPIPIVVTHGSPEHAVTVFVDKEYRLRATSVADIVQRIAEVTENRVPYSKRFVPCPKDESVPLSGLDNHQVTIIALSDGKRSVNDLSRIMEIPEMRVKILCEQLVRMGRLDTVRVVIGEE